MTNKIFAMILSLMMLVAVPYTAKAASAIEIIDTEIQNITVTVNESVLHVTGANGEVMHIYNVTGMKLMSVRVEDKRIEINLPKGCYIVKIGKVVRKIYIK